MIQSVFTIDTGESQAAEEKYKEALAGLRLVASCHPITFDVLNKYASFLENKGV